MRSVLFIALLSYVFNFHINAQTKSMYPAPVWALKWNPLALIDFSTPAIQLGAERRLGNKFSINAEAGYLMNFNNRAFVGIDSRKGTRVRVEGRYYWDSFMNEEASTFIGFATVYRYTNEVRRSLIERFNNAYTEALDYHYIRHNFGAYFTTGGVFRFKRPLKSLEKNTTVYSPLSIELSVGLGLRYTSVEPTQLPNDAVLIADSNTLTFEPQPSDAGTRYVAPSAQIGIRLLYILTAKT